MTISENLKNFKKANSGQGKAHLLKLRKVVMDDQNTFEQLMETVKFCSLGEITHTLFNVGGQYRRNM